MVAHKTVAFQKCPHVLILEQNVLNDPNDLWEIVESRGDEGGALNECYLIVICEKAENSYLYVQNEYNIVNLKIF